MRDITPMNRLLVRPKCNGRGTVMAVIVEEPGLADPFQRGDEVRYDPDLCTHLKGDSWAFDIVSHGASRVEVEKNPSVYRSSGNVARSNAATPGTHEADRDGGPWGENAVRELEEAR